GQVGHDSTRRHAELASLECQGIDMANLQSAGIGSGNILQGRQAALVFFDGDEPRRTLLKECARQSAWPRTDFDRRPEAHVPGSPPNPGGEIQIEQEMLP